MNEQQQKTMTKSEAVEATNKWWSDQYQALDRLALESMRKAETEINILKAENENLKAKLENRDLNLDHLRSIIEEMSNQYQALRDHKESTLKIQEVV